MFDFVALARAIGGTWQSNGDETWTVVVRVGCLDFGLRGFSEGLITLQLSGQLASERIPLDEMLTQPAARKFLKLLGLTSDDAQVVTASSGAVVIFAQPQTNRPDPAAVLEWLTAISELARPLVLEPEPWCECCGLTEGELTVDQGDVSRYCFDCARAVRQAQAELAASARPGEAEGGMLLPPVSAESVAFYERARLRHPTLYRVKLLVWVALGQLAMVGGAGLALLLLAGLVGATVALIRFGVGIWLISLGKVLLTAGGKLAVVLLALLAALLSSVGSLFRRPPPHEVRGLHLQRHQAPRFFAWLDGIGERLNAPRVDVLVLQEDMNAAVAELGNWWQRRRYLLLGIPILETFSLEELETVMGHELAHLIHGDPAASWIYRTAQGWADLAAHHQSLGGFANWYVPRFLLRAQVWCRAQELAADRRAEGLGDGARALLKLQLIGGLYGEVLTDTLHRAALESRLEDFDLLNDVRPTLVEEAARRGYEVLEDGYLEQADWTSSHPGLKDRLSNLNFNPTELSRFQLELGECHQALFDDYSSLRAQVMAPLQRNLRAQARLQALRLPGLRPRLERYQSQLQSQESDELRLAIAHCALGLNQTQLAEESLRAARGEIARQELLGLLMAENRVAEALEVLPATAEPLQQLALRRRNRDWPACLAICQEMLADENLDPELRPLTEARLELYRAYL